jgi:N6-L-threonylcarbamoyladenine synthase
MKRQRDGMLTIGVESTFNNSCVCVLDEELTVHYERGETFSPSSPSVVQDGPAWQDELRAFHARLLPTLLREALDVAPAPDFVSVSVVDGKQNANVEIANDVVRRLAALETVPLVAVDHHEAHLLAGLLCDPPPQFPFVGLTVAGGHCHLQLAAGVGSYRLLGSHDAAVRNRFGHGRAPGAVLDKCSELLGLVPFGQPDGAIAIDKCASKRPEWEYVPFPRTEALNARNSYDIDLHELYEEVMERKNASPSGDVELLAVSAQECVMRILLDKTFAAADAFDAPRVSFGGGVTANSRLRTLAAARAARSGAQIYFPDQELCVDNARMIAFAGLIAAKPELANRGHSSRGAACES